MTLRDYGLLEQTIFSDLLNAIIYCYTTFRRRNFPGNKRCVVVLFYLKKAIREPTAAYL